MDAPEYRCQAERRAQVTAARHLPNLLTLFRLASVPVTVWLTVGGNLGAAFWLFVAAGLTDALDGALARALGAQTALGSYLDALADKVLLVSIFLSLGGLGLLPGWLVGLVVARDLLIGLAALVMYVAGWQRQVAPLTIGKINTLVQIALAAVTLGHHGLGWFAQGLIAPLCWLTAITASLSILGYLWSWKRRLGTNGLGGRGGDHLGN